MSQTQSPLNPPLTTSKEWADAIFSTISEIIDWCEREQREKIHTSPTMLAVNYYHRKERLKEKLQKHLLDLLDKPDTAKETAETLYNQIREWKESSYYTAVLQYLKVVQGHLPPHPSLRKDKILPTVQGSLAKINSVWNERIIDKETHEALYRSLHDIQTEFTALLSFKQKMDAMRPLSLTRQEATQTLGRFVSKLNEKMEKLLPDIFFSQYRPVILTKALAPILESRRNPETLRRTLIEFTEVELFKGTDATCSLLELVSQMTRKYELSSKENRRSSFQQWKCSGLPGSSYLPNLTDHCRSTYVHSVGRVSAGNQSIRSNWK